jgi:hypothetical protein
MIFFQTTKPKRGFEMSWREFEISWRELVMNKWVMGRDGEWIRPSSPQHDPGDDTFSPGEPTIPLSELLAMGWTKKSPTSTPEYAYVPRDPGASQESPNEDKNGDANDNDNSSNL